MRARRTLSGIVVCVLWSGLGVARETPETDTTGPAKPEEPYQVPKDTYGGGDVTPRSLQPGTAAALGGILGLGSGYYYSRSYVKGVVFSLIDIVAIGALTSEGGTGPSGYWIDLDVSPGVDVVAGAALAASHVIQGLDGPADARRYNRRHRAGLLGSPLAVSFGSGLFGDGGSPWLEDLWAEGGAGRDLAAAVEQVRRERPPLEVRFELDSPGVLLGWQSTF